MSPSDFSLAPAPLRRNSLVSRPRPSTACGIPSKKEDYSARRLSALPPMSQSMFDSYESRHREADWLAQPDTLVDLPDVRPLDSSPLEKQALPLHRRSSLSASFKTSVNELRSLGRRMSVSMRLKGGKNKNDLNNAPQAAPIKLLDPSLQPEGSGPWSAIKTKPKAWLRTTNLRRRPSLPLLSHPGSDDPPSYTAGATLPGGNRGPPILPNDLNGGAGARAAAAAQNEALQEALQSINRFSLFPLEPVLSRVSEMKLTRDSESGIGIDMRDRRESVESDIHIIRRDPAEYLAIELMEQIFCYLDPLSLLQAEQVSRDWHSQARSRPVWRHVFRREYRNGKTPTSLSRSLGPKPAMGLGKGTPDQDWKKMYLVRRAIDRRWAKGEAAAIYLNGHKDSVYCVQFDEHKIITGSRDRTIRVWDTHTYQCIKKIGPPVSHRDRTNPDLDPVNPQGLHPFCSINTSSTDPSVGPAPVDFHQASILCLQFDDEIMVTGSSDFTCIVWSMKDNYRPIRRLRGHTAGVLDVCIDDRYIITCSKDTTILIWDRYTGELLKRLTGHRGPVNAVQVRGNLLASASGDGMSKLWNLNEGVCIKEFSSKDRGLACVEFSEDGRTIFAGGNDQVIYEYDTHTGKVVRELRGHKDLVRSLHLDAANNRLVSGSYDKSVKVWDGKQGCHSRDGGLKINFEGWTTSWMLAAKSDYRKIVCTSQDGRVVIIDFGYGLEGADMLQA